MLRIAKYSTKHRLNPIFANKLATFETNKDALFASYMTPIQHNSAWRRIRGAMCVANLPYSSIYGLPLD